MRNSTEEIIRDLEAKLYRAHTTIIQMMPKDTQQLFDGYVHC